MQDCKGFFKLFFCIIPKAASDGGEKKTYTLLLLTQNHRFFHLSSPEVSVRQNSGRKVDIWVRSNDSHSLLSLPFPNLISLLPTPHTGGFCHDFTHWVRCYLRKLHKHIRKWLGGKKKKEKSTF